LFSLIGSDVHEKKKITLYNSQAKGLEFILFSCRTLKEQREAIDGILDTVCAAASYIKVQLARLRMTTKKEQHE